MLGEFDLIALLRERIAAAGAPAGDHVIVGSGDDAAVVEPRGPSVTTVDALVEGVHFKRSTFPADAIGHKALAVALSDLAAMGAQPGEAYIQLGVPEDASEDELAAIADGLGAVAHEYSVSVAGGDVVASPVLFLAVTAVGYVHEKAVHVTRAGAQEGDVLILTGPVGGAAAGLLLLENEALAEGLEPAQADALRERQLRPRALTGAGLALARSGARAMIDVSDGIGADAGHLAAASGVALHRRARLRPDRAGRRSGRRGSGRGSARAGKWRRGLRAARGGAGGEGRRGPRCRSQNRLRPGCDGPGRGWGGCGPARPYRPRSFE